MSTLSFRGFYAVVGALLSLAACATSSPRPRTAIETRAQEAFDACWAAGGPPTPNFVPIQERGTLYAVMDVRSVEQHEKIASCMAARGVSPTWGFPPSMMGGTRAR